MEKCEMTDELFNTSENGPLEELKNKINSSNINTQYWV